MKEFKSKTGNSLGQFFLLTICYLGILYLLLFLTINFRLSQLSFSAWLLFTLIYLLIFYLYAGFTNNDILLFNNKIEIVNRLPLFKKHIVLPIDKVKSVKFRHEWTETFGKNIKPHILKYILVQLIAPLFFPSDYKWIEFNADKEYKFYCFGIEMDYYTNEDPIFEDLFRQLSDKGINVSWTDLPDVYYNSMNKDLE